LTLKGSDASFTRNYRIDNIRFILIFLTVLGHLLLVNRGHINRMIIRIIYSFHMPAFIFIMGLLANFSLKKYLKGLIFPYIVFQTAYILFDRRLFFPESAYSDSFSIQFSTPFWLLWYLFTAAFYYLLIPALSKLQTGYFPALLAVSFALSILVGYIDSVGYFLSLSRTIVFLPFFILGFYFKKRPSDSFIKDRARSVKWTMPFLITIPIAVLEFIFAKNNVTLKVFYGSYPYAAGNTGAGLRISFLITAILWIILLFSVIPNKQIPFVTRVGSYTLPIYLLHGFVVMVLKKLSILHYSDPLNLLLSLLFTILIVFLLSTQPIRLLFKKFF